MNGRVDVHKSRAKFDFLCQEKLFLFSHILQNYEARKKGFCFNFSHFIHHVNVNMASSFKYSICLFDSTRLDNSFKTNYPRTLIVY